MRNLSDTGADKVKGPGLHEHIGAVLVIERKPSIEEAPEFPGHYKAHIIATDEATGAQREYLSGAARLIGQASMIQSSWNGEPVRVKVAGRLNKWGNPSVWLEEAPPAQKAPDTTPVYTAAEQDARADFYRLIEEKHIAPGIQAALIKKYSDALGRTDYPAALAHLKKAPAPAKAPDKAPDKMPAAS